MRLDQLLITRGLFDSRAQARAAIEAGGVTVAGQVVRKPAAKVAEDAIIEAEAAHPFVGRGALKLDHALTLWPIAVEGRSVLDVGASTGGFTEVCLIRGAAKVHAVDVGHGQLHDRIAADPRVVVTSSLAKGLGGAGGIVAGSGSFVTHCHRSSGYICTTPIAPALAEGTRAALRLLQQQPDRLDALHANASRLRTGLRRLGLLTDSDERTTPIAAFTIGDSPTMQRLASGLLVDGFRVPLIRYPGGPAEAYFRLSVNAEHNSQQIDGLLSAFESRLLEEKLPAHPEHAAQDTLI